MRPVRADRVGDTLFFTADDGVHGRELWKSDGTRAGTVLVKDIRPGRQRRRPAALTAVGRDAVLHADDGTHGAELWKTDGTRAGTVLVKDIRPGAGGSRFETYRTRRLTSAGGTLFFDADDGVHGNELWRSDGSAAGTGLVRDIRPGPDDGLDLDRERPMMSVGSTLFFSADDGTQQTQLWKTTGTSAGTVSLTEFTQDYYYGNVPTQLTDVDGTLFFTAMELGGHGNEGADGLWKSDGTKAGTVLVEPMDGYAYPSNLTAVGDTLFFESFDFMRGAELWKSNGTTAGTSMVKDIAPSTGYPATSSFPDHLTAVGRQVFFSADDDVHGRELWRSDGTEPGTVLVKDIRPGPGASDPASLAAVGRTLFFSADDGTHGAKLWESVSPRAGTVLVRDIDPTPPCAGTSPAAPDPARSGPGPARAAPARPQLG